MGALSNATYGQASTCADGRTITPDSDTDTWIHADDDTPCDHGHA